MPSGPLRYINTKGNVHRFRRGVPAPLQAAIGRKWIVHPLGSDLAKAKVLRNQFERDTDKLFDDARKGRLKPDQTDPATALGQQWAEERMAYEKDSGVWTKTVFGKAEDEETLSVHSFIGDEAERVERQHGVEARARFLNYAYGRDPVSSRIEDYLRRAERELAPKTIRERRSHLQWLAKWADAKGLTVSDIGPSKASEYADEKLAPKHYATAIKELGSLVAYWNELPRFGIVTQGNPWVGQIKQPKKRRVERGDDETERPFTEEEMRKLLFGELPTRMAAEKKSAVEDAIRLSALSGLRIAELATLQVSECGDGIFRIQQGKSASSVRQVPIHPALFSIIERRAGGRRPNDWLFSEVETMKAPSDQLGKWFARYRIAKGVTDKREDKRRDLLNFHSLRRWFAQQARTAGQSMDIIAEVLGHELPKEARMTGRYTGEAAHQLKRECVESVQLPGRR